MSQELLAIVQQLGEVRAATEANQVSTQRNIDELWVKVDELNAKMAGKPGYPGICERLNSLERWREHITRKVYGLLRRFWAIVGAVAVLVARIAWSLYNGS